MTIEQLAERRTILQQRLQAISLWNTYRQKHEDVVAVALDQVKTQKELFEAENKIRDYIEGRSS